MLFLEYDWTALVYRFRFGQSFIAFGRWEKRSFATMSEARGAAADCGLTIGPKTASRSWQVSLA